MSQELMNQWDAGLTSLWNDSGAGPLGRWAEEPISWWAELRARSVWGPSKVWGGISFGQKIGHDMVIPRPKLIFGVQAKMKIGILVNGLLPYLLQPLRWLGIHQSGLASAQRSWLSDLCDDAQCEARSLAHLKESLPQECGSLCL